MQITVTTTHISAKSATIGWRLKGSDVWKVTAETIGPAQQWAIVLHLCGEAADANGPQLPIILSSVESPASWSNGEAGAKLALDQVFAMIRQCCGGSAQCPPQGWLDLRGLTCLNALDETFGISESLLQACIIPSIDFCNEANKEALTPQQLACITQCGPAVFRIGGVVVATADPPCNADINIECDEPIPGLLVLEGCGCPLANSLYTQDEGGSTWTNLDGTRWIIPENPLALTTVWRVATKPDGGTIFYQTTTPASSPTDEGLAWEVIDGPGPAPSEVRQAGLSDICPCPDPDPCPLEIYGNNDILIGTVSDPCSTPSQVVSIVDDEDFLPVGVLGADPWTWVVPKAKSLCAQITEATVQEVKDCVISSGKRDALRCSLLGDVEPETVEEDVYDCLTVAAQDALEAAVCSREVFVYFDMAIDNDLGAVFVVPAAAAGTYTSVTQDGASGTIEFSINGGPFATFVNPTDLVAGDTIQPKRSVDTAGGWIQINGTY